MQSSTEVIPPSTGAPSHDPNLWDQIEDYRHDGLCKRFAKKYGMSFDQVETVFLETKRFLYVAMVSQEPCSPSRVVDDMWHEFLCYTAAYRSFCADFSGEFIDHAPSNKPEVEGYARTKALAEQFFGQLDALSWPEPSLANAGDCTCSNQGCSDNCTSNLSTCIYKQAPGSAPLQ